MDAYVRDSGGPRQEASTDQQLAEIEAYCLQHGLVLRHKFADVARSGGSTISRDEFNRMMDATRQPETKPNGLLLWNYARFARDLDDAIYYKALLRNRGVIVHSLTDPVPEGQYGRIVEFFIDISNEEKRRQTSTDAKRGLRDLVANHGCVPGVPPRGFIREEVQLPSRRDGSFRVAHRWVPDPDLRDQIKCAFRMRATGSTLRKIHTELHLFSCLNSYKTFFDNRIYIGILEYGGQEYEHYCEPLIEMADWEAVQKRIEAHSQARFTRFHPRRLASTYVLSGMVYCGQCGAPMSSNTATNRRGRDDAYRCSRSRRMAGCTQGRISRRILETAVITTLRNYILLPESLAAMLEIQQKSGDRNEEQRLIKLSSLRTERQKLSRHIANLTRAIAEHGHTTALLDRLGELEGLRAQTNTGIAEMETRHYEPLPSLTPEQIDQLSVGLIKLLSEGTTEQIRDMLNALVYKVVVMKDADKKLIGSITYYPPPINTSPLPDGKGECLHIGTCPHRETSYTQTFSHPIIF